MPHLQIALTSFLNALLDETAIPHQPFQTSEVKNRLESVAMVGVTGPPVVPARVPISNSPLYDNRMNCTDFV